MFKDEKLRNEPTMHYFRGHIPTWLFTCAGGMFASLSARPAQVPKTVVMQLQADLFPMASCKQSLKVD